jgi:hypothetical protein
MHTDCCGNPSEFSALTADLGRGRLDHRPFIRLRRRNVRANSTKTTLKPIRAVQLSRRGIEALPSKPRSKLLTRYVIGEQYAATLAIPWRLAIGTNMPPINSSSNLNNATAQ